MSFIAVLKQTNKRMKMKLLALALFAATLALATKLCAFIDQTSKFVDKNRIGKIHLPTIQSCFVVVA